MTSATRRSFWAGASAAGGVGAGVDTTGSGGRRDTAGAVMATCAGARVGSAAGAGSDGRCLGRQRLGRRHLGRQCLGGDEFGRRIGLYRLACYQAERFDTADPCKMPVQPDVPDVAEKGAGLEAAVQHGLEVVQGTGSVAHQQFDLTQIDPIDVITVDPPDPELPRSRPSPRRSRLCGQRRRHERHGRTAHRRSC